MSAYARAVHALGAEVSGFEFALCQLGANGGKCLRHILVRLYLRLRH